jgi:hypothetical protein
MEACVEEASPSWPLTGLICAEKRVTSPHFLDASFRPLMPNASFKIHTCNCVFSLFVFAG